MADETVITFQIPGDKYKYLQTVLNNHKDFLHRLGVSDVIKNELVRDMHIIRSILETGRKEQQE